MRSRLPSYPALPNPRQKVSLRLRLPAVIAFLALLNASLDRRSFLSVFGPFQGVVRRGEFRLNYEFVLGETGERDDREGDARCRQGQGKASDLRGRAVQGPGNLIRCATR